MFNSFRVIRCLSQLRKSKNRYFYHIFVSAGDAPAAITINVVWMQREFSACQTLAACTRLSWTVSQLFEPQVQKIAVFTYRSPHFCFPRRRPCDHHAIYCMDGKTIQCLQHVPIYIQYFPSYTMLKSMRKSKSRYFYHILVSPAGAPGTITLNVIWMEREFDAYKLSRRMYSSNYNRLSDRARYWLKIVIFHTPLHSTPPLGGGVAVGIAPPRLVRKN